MSENRLNREDTSFIFPSSLISKVRSQSSPAEYLMRKEKHHAICFPRKKNQIFLIISFDRVDLNSQKFMFDVKNAQISHFP